MLQTQRNKYLETTVQTASPSQLLIMLYDGAIRACKIAIEALKQNNYQEAHSNLIKAQDIVSEFMITLDQGSPIAEGLWKLYDYFNYRLREANMHKSVEPVEEVLEHLMELKETWIQASKAVMGTTAGARHG